MSDSNNDQNQINKLKKRSQIKENKRKETDKDNWFKRILNDEEFKEKRHQRFLQKCRDASIVRKIVFVLIVILTVIIIYAGKSAYDYVVSGLSPVDPDDNTPVEVEIPLGSSTTTIANILEENGIINDELMYRLYIKINNYADFQAGSYQLTPSMSLAEISATLQTGSVIRDSLFSVTIPEGRTLEQIAVLFENNTNIDAADFMDLMTDKDYIRELIDLYPNLLSEEILEDGIRYPLEGYLFASTYPFYEENPTVDDIVRMMLDRTDDVMQGYYHEIDGLGNFTVHDVLTFASLVEREARDEAERKLISGVFYNRLEEGMRLETDPTVLYAHGQHKERVLFKDLEIESPYNTYYVYGLPIGPISNFGTSSLDAVFNPTNTNYLFFVAAPDGEIYFSETFEEHRRLANEHLDRDV